MKKPRQPRACDVFISRPTVVGDEFEAGYQTFDAFLSKNGIKARRLGKSDYSRQAPLTAVFGIIDECRGAIILGYPQFSMRHEAIKNNEPKNRWGYLFPTPWNQIEGALAFRAKTPVLVVAHPGVEGGVFDHGVTGEGVLHIDLSTPKWFRSSEFQQPFTEWLDDVKAATAAGKS